MTTSYANNLRIAEIGTGDQAGVWGITTNYNLATLLGEAIAGYTSITIGSSTTDQALSAFNGATDQSRQAIILLTGSPSANFFIYAPPATKTYFFRNNTSVTATIRVATALNGTTWTNGAQVAIPPTCSVIVACDGTNVYEGVNSVIGNFAVGGTLTAGGNGTFSGTGNLVVPVGTTAQRGGNTTGAIRFNSSLLTYEGYNGTAWGALGGGSSGGGTNQAFFENDKTITVSYTITNGKNAMSAGPMTLASGFAGNATLTLDGTTGAGYILNVSGTSAGALYLGTVVTGTGIPANTTITAFGSGSGGNGTYTVTYAGAAVSLTAPTAIASTVVVTVPSGSNWVVVG
jgi:hypothetical protein